VNKKPAVMLDYTNYGEHISHECYLTTKFIQHCFLRQNGMCAAVTHYICIICLK